MLDLDETLIHYDKETGKLKRRPHLKYFLYDVSKSWNIMVFTASVQKYADTILDLIDPTNIIQKRLYRDQCTKIDQNYYKDLAQINKDLSWIVIVDNYSTSFELQ